VKESSRKRRGWRYWRNLGVFALAAGCIGILLLIYVGHPYYLSRGWAHPRRLAVCCMTPADYGLNYKEISFVTSDGLTLQGWYIPSTNGAAVILTHPLASNRVGVLEVAYMLARNGYGVLLFDLRAHGESQGEVLPFGGAEAEDIVGAAVYLQGCEDVDPDRIGAMGVSLGAQVSILGAAQSGTIKAVVADGPCCTTFEDWPRPQSLGEWLYVPYDLIFFRMLRWHTGVSEPMSVQEAIARIAPRAVLLIGGGSERYMLEHHSRAAQEPKALWIIPEAGHIEGRSRKPEEYEERVVGFFDQVLLREYQYRCPGERQSGGACADFGARRLGSGQVSPACGRAGPGQAQQLGQLRDACTGLLLGKQLGLLLSSACDRHHTMNAC
jgi:fermentation-respiration switch protein FrsA (DUF1100 family)